MPLRCPSRLPPRRANHARRTMGAMQQHDGAEVVADVVRDATRAAELAERLTSEAAAALEQADLRAAESEEIALLAERAAVAASHAAERARAVATRAAMVAQELRAGERGDRASRPPI
jgi:hypothetical protein